MRTFVSGSKRNVDSQSHEQFDHACKQIGVEIAKRGHIALIMSEGKTTADYPLVCGIAQYFSIFFHLANINLQAFNKVSWLAPYGL